MMGPGSYPVRKRAPFLDFSVTGGFGGKGWEGQSRLSPTGS